MVQVQAMSVFDAFKNGSTSIDHHFSPIGGEIATGGGDGEISSVWWRDRVLSDTTGLPAVEGNSVGLSSLSVQSTT